MIFIEKKASAIWIFPNLTGQKQSGHTVLRFYCNNSVIHVHNSVIDIIFGVCCEKLSRHRKVVIEYRLSLIYFCG